MQTASQLFAISQGSTCHGDLRCHWCGAPAERAPHLRHDDPIPPIANRNWNKNLAKFPGEGYVCQGCWLWRRPGVTANFLTENPPDKTHKKTWHYQKDKQCAMKHSWLVTEDWAYALRWDDRQELYKFLLSPPKRFMLALLDKEEENRLHLAVVNDHQGDVLKGTEFHFTVNNIPHVYTSLGLELALRGDNGDVGSGVRALLGLFGTEYEGLEPIPAKESSDRRGPRALAENQSRKKV